MHKPSFFKNIINFIAKKYGENPGKMLVHTGVIGWALSSLAQVFAIVINDKIPKEQKMFLIPQEIADACVNIVSFYVITQSVKSIANKAVSMGKWLPKSVRQFLTDNKIQNIGKKGFDVLRDGNLTEDLVSKYTKFNNGVDVVATTLGSVLSCNIVTPVIRNEIAARRQKKSLDKLNKPYNVISNVKNKEDVSYIQRPTMSAFQSTAKNNYYSPNKNSLAI